MTAVYQLALMYYFTDNTAYLSKATAIWDGWATTMTSLQGSDGYLQVGDIAPYLFGGPDILRGTYPGWTAQDTTDSINYYNNVIRPLLVVPEPVRGANQGMAQIKCAMALAVCVDDTNYWNEALFAYRNDAAGLPDAAPIGMVGDTGRDPGHWGDQMAHLFWAAAVAWSQGVDLFSEDNNRLAKVAEYYSQWAQCNFVPWVPFGSIYGLYPQLGCFELYEELHCATLDCLRNRLRYGGYRTHRYQLHRHRSDQRPHLLLHYHRRKFAGTKFRFHRGQRYARQSRGLPQI